MEGRGDFGFLVSVLSAGGMRAQALPYALAVSGWAPSAKGLVTHPRTAACFQRLLRRSWKGTWQNHCLHHHGCITFDISYVLSGQPLSVNRSLLAASMYWFMTSSSFCGHRRLPEEAERDRSLMLERAKLRTPDYTTDVPHSQNQARDRQAPPHAKQLGIAH